MEFPQYSMNDRALIIFDQHWSHLDPVTVECLNRLNCDHQLIPAKSTDNFSVLDVAINKPFKGHIKDSFSKWCTNQIMEQIRRKIPPCQIKLDIRTSEIKPYVCEWIDGAFKHLNSIENLVQNGRRKIDDTIHSIISDST